MSAIATILRRLFTVSAILLLAACGGGGGGGGGRDDPGRAGGMSVSPTSLAFTAPSGGATPVSQTITVTITASDAVSVLAGVPSGSTLPNWLSISWLNTPGSPRLSVVINTTTLSPGNYTTTLRVGIARADNSLIAYRDVPVTYTVTNKISATPAALSFTQFVGGTAAPAQSLTFSDNGGRSYPWTASVSYQTGSAWLILGAAGGSSLPAPISVSVNPNAAAGTYNATITASGNGDSVNIPVSYSVRAPGLVLSQANVSFSARNAQTSPPPARDVSVSTENGTAVSYATTINYGAGSPGWLTVTGNVAPGPLSIVPNTVNLSAGTYTATVRVTPSNGANAVNIGVSYTVQASTISANPAQVSFSAFSGQTSLPIAANVTISTSPGDNLTYTTTITYGTGASGWLGTTGSSAPGTLSIAPTTTNLTARTYTATVRLTPSTGAAAINIGVTYTVAASTLTLSPSSPTYTITPSSTAIPSTLDRSVAVGSTGAPLTWTATSSDPWLTVSPASGTSGQTVTLSLVPAQIDVLEAGTRLGTITFSYSPPSGSAASAPLVATLNLQLPKVNFVAPYTALPNTSKEVIVRGSGFNHATGLSLMIGTNAVSTYTVLSGTEIRVTHPSLPASSYQVRIPNQFGISRTRANLVVATPPSFSYQAIPTSLVRKRTIYDAERISVYTNNQAQYFGPAGLPRVERHRFTASGWVTDAIPITGFPVDMVMTPDGRELVAISLTTLYHIDLNTWAISSQLPIASASPYNNSDFGQLAMGNDGNALVFGTQWSRPYRYNVLTKQFSSSSTAMFWSVQALTSGDSSRIFLTQNSSDPAHFYDVSQGQFISTGLNLANSFASYDRAGYTLITGGSVYNRQFVLQGTSGGLVRSAVSADGTRGYGFDYTGSILRTYDLTSPNGTSGFTEIGTGIAVPDSPGDFPTLGISSDERAVFISGESRFIIQPVP